MNLCDIFLDYLIFYAIIVIRKKINNILFFTHLWIKPL